VLCRWAFLSVGSRKKKFLVSEGGKWLCFFCVFAPVPEKEIPDFIAVLAHGSIIRVFFYGNLYGVAMIGMYSSGRISAKLGRKASIPQPKAQDNITTDSARMIDSTETLSCSVGHRSS